MFTRTRNNSSISVDFEGGYIASIRLGEKEIIGYKTPLFTVGLRNDAGELSCFTSCDSKKCVLDAEIIDLLS